MPDHLQSTQLAYFAVQTVVLLLGAWVCWWVQFSRSGVRMRQSRLPGWALESSGFGLAMVEALTGGVAGLMIARFASSWLPKSVADDTAFATVILNSGLHLGVLAGIAVYCLTNKPSAAPENVPNVPEPIHPPLRTGQCFGAGFLTFCATVAVLLPVSWLWNMLLQFLGIPAPKQDLIEIFAKADTPVKLLAMSVMAIVIAPMTEELAFRAGFFRFLRGRLPRWLAYVLPAAVFALLHNTLAVFAPLFVLGLVFANAYERTGRVLVPIIAHALFNLNSIVFILVGGANL